MPDLPRRIDLLERAKEWQTWPLLREGVRILVLDEGLDGSGRIALLRYDPGANVPAPGAEISSTLDRRVRHSIPPGNIHGTFPGVVDQTPCHRIQRVGISTITDTRSESSQSGCPMPDGMPTIGLGDGSGLDPHRVARIEREPDVVLLVRRVQRRQDVEREGALVVDLHRIKPSHNQWSIQNCTASDFNG